MKDGIQVSHLCKCYGDMRAVDDISFQVEQGEIFAFLGPNGAGKSTTISILCTLTDFQSGEVMIHGYHRPYEDEQICKKLGVVFQDSCLDQTLSVRENLLYRSGLYGLFGINAKNRVEEVLSQCHLTSIQRQKVAHLSGGQRRRADIARALIANPSLLILDEPSTGLDPKARNALWNTIDKIHIERNITVFMTTHYMEEAEIADHIAILNHGKIVLDGRKEVLVKQHQKDHLHLYSTSMQSMERVLMQHHIPYEKKEAYLRVDVDNFFTLMSILRHTELYLHNIELIKGSMEELYLHTLKEEM